MLARVLPVLLALTAIAAAQQATPPQQSLIEQALGQKLIEEVNANILLRVQLLTAQARIRDLEAAQVKSGDGKQDK